MASVTKGIRRKPIEARGADGSALGGPGPTPSRPEPANIQVGCPGCGRAQPLDARSMARKLWNGLPRGDGEAFLEPETLGAFDAIGPGWDVRCGSCRAGFRILYTLEEWGKMSGAFFPVVGEALWLDEAGDKGHSPTSTGIDIEVSDEPADEPALAVDSGLDQYNHESAPVGDVRKLGAFARAPSGEVVGGAVGRTWGRCCELLQLWVAREHRDRGVGSRLVREFEARARTRGCDIFYLTTLSFQAPDFYRKHGYGVLAKIDGYPGGIAKYLMHKVDGEGAR